MSVELLQPHVLFDGVTGITHYETVQLRRAETFEDRSEEIIREILDANFSAWCDATGTLGGLPTYGFGKRTLFYSARRYAQRQLKGCTQRY